jgi:hypothetical protein
MNYLTTGTPIGGRSNSESIRKIKKQDRSCYLCLMENGDWPYLLRLMWSCGFRLAKVQLLKEGLDIETYEP